MHVNVKLSERLRESRAYVRQAAGLRERVNLGRCKEDTQQQPPGRLMAGCDNCKPPLVGRN